MLTDLVFYAFWFILLMSFCRLHLGGRVMINLTKGKSLYQLIAVRRQLLCLRLADLKFGLFLFDGLIALVDYLVICCSAIYLYTSMDCDNILTRPLVVIVKVTV